eukprot:scaffold63219_cov33-Tisochrysis_lutea.AAC.8
MQRNIGMVLTRADHTLRALLGECVRLSDRRVARNTAEMPAPFEFLRTTFRAKCVPAARAAAREVYLHAL